MKLIINIKSDDQTISVAFEDFITWRIFPEQCNEYGSFVRKDPIIALIYQTNAYTYEFRFRERYFLTGTSTNLITR